MFDFEDQPALGELGSRRRPTKWAVELSLADCRPQKHKQRRRQLAQQQAAAGGGDACSAGQQQQAQQQARQARQALQRAAAQQRHAAQIAELTRQHPLSLTPAQAKYRAEFRDTRVVCLSTEIEQGNVEYKYRLTGCGHSEHRRHQLVTQMKFRLSEGCGECFYYLGVEDDGYPRGLEPHELQDTMAALHSMAALLQATARLVEYVPGGFGRTAALMHITANVQEGNAAPDSRVAVAGSMDSGKSTLVAVLTNGSDGAPLLDNGRGSARMAVFRHKHEIESGRTSSISQQVLGYDGEGRVLNYVGVATPTPADICASASRVLNFLDMGGHEKYLKTTLYGMTCLLPDYALLCVDAASGITRITREHLAVAVALEVPTALVLTKADAVSSEQMLTVLEQLRHLMQPVLQQQQGQGGAASACECQRGHANSSPSIDIEQQQQPASCCGEGAKAAAPVAAAAAAGSDAGSLHSGVPVVQSEAQAVALAARLSQLHSCTAEPSGSSFQQAVFPVFVVSCVSGAGLPQLHAFLSHLQPLGPHKQHSSGGGGSSCSSSGANGAGWSQQQGPAAASISAARPDGSSRLWGLRQQPAAAPSEAGLHAPGSMTMQQQEQQQQEQRQQEQQEQQQVAAAQRMQAAAGHFQVVHTYDVEGVGSVVSGIAVSGSIEVGQSLLWGPTADGGFSPVRVSCIQRSHVPVRQIGPGQTATLALEQTAGGAPPTGSKQALLAAAAVAQATAAEEAAREAAAAIAAVPDPVAKTRRRSPAALKAAAAAAASTAAAAAAAADAARRAAATIGGQAWWLQEPAAALSGQLACGQEASAAADPTGLLLADDGFAAGLAAEDSDGSDGSDVMLFGSEDEAVSGCSNRHRTAAAAATAGSGEAFDFDEELAGLLLGDGDDDADDTVTGAAAAGSLAASQLASRCSSSSSGSSMQAAEGSETPHSFSGALPPPVPRCRSEPVPVAAAALSGACAAPRSAASVSLSQPRQASPSRLLGTSPPSWRSKGAVLLGAAAAPHIHWEFEALLVLLGGHWAPRGLLSGSWPPAAKEAAAADAGAAAAIQSAGAGSFSDDAACSHAEGSMTQQRRRRGRKQQRDGSSKANEFAYVIHCNSIRQIARVVSMQEAKQHEEAEGASASGSACDATAAGSSSIARQAQPQQHRGLTASIQAAAALLQHQWCPAPPASGSASDKDAGSSGSGSADSGSERRQRQRLGVESASPSGGGASARRPSEAGSVVAVRFRFTHRPQWMQVGARLIVRDRSNGHVAAAGFVTRLLEPHQQQQQEAAVGAGVVV